MRMYLTSAGWTEAGYPFQATADKINALLDGLKEVPHTRTQFFDLCGYLFEHLSTMITSFPTAIIQDPQTIQLTLVFSGVSAGLVALFSIGEGLKGVLGMRYTKMTTFLGRTIAAFLGAGLTIPAMILIMNTLKIVIDWLLSIGHHSLTGTVLFSSTMSEIVNDGGINFAVAIFFMIAFCLFCLKAMLDTGVRWFDMICNAVVSPIAWCCSITDTTKGFFDKWLSSTTGLFLTNVIYAFYLTVIVSITLAPWEVNTIGLTGRLVLIVGAFWRLVKPPAWVSNLSGEGSGAAKMLMQALILRGIKLPKLK